MFTKECIKEHFFTRPNDKLRVREIERTLSLSLPSVIRSCKELEQEGILTTITYTNIKLYTASKNDTFFFHKKLDNLRKLSESGLITHLKQELHNPTIVLFGSYSRGEDDEQSDIDLYVETTKTTELKQYEEALARKIQLFTYENIYEVKNKHLANNILNGITLNKQVVVFDELE